MPIAIQTIQPGSSIRESVPEVVDATPPSTYKAEKKADKAGKTYTKEAAAQIFVTCIKEFQARRDEAAKKAIKMSETHKFKCFYMTTWVKTDHRGKPLTFYFDIDSKAMLARRPKEPVEGGPDGKFKCLVAQDAYYVELSIQNSRDFDSKYPKLHKLAQHLAPYPSCCWSVRISKDTLLARSGGNEMYDLIYTKKEKIDINCFWQSCTDLAKMHKKGIYLRDIKPENMAVREVRGKKRQAMFIDTDDAAIPSLQNYRGGCATIEMTTEALIKGRRDGDLKLIAAGDNYAKLLIMTEATDLVLRNHLVVPQWRQVKESEYDPKTRSWVEKEKDRPFIKSRVDDENEPLFKQWIETHVKPVYQEGVMQFLLDPAENPLPADLVDVINWTD